MHSDIETYLKKNPRPEVIDVLVPDANGILRGKKFDGDSLEKLYEKGANFPISLLFCDAQGATAEGLLQPPLAGDPDTNYKPVLGTLVPVPWEQVPTAQLMLRAVNENGESRAYDPLAVLERQVERLKAAGLFPTIALEGEFYLLDPKHDPPRPLKPENGWPAFEGPQVYALEPLRDVQGFLNQVKEVAKVQGIPLTSILCEYGASQFEMNLNHSSDILAHCHHYLMLKHAIRNIAASNGQLASFMAKPLDDQTSSGCHIHMSVCDADSSNVFGDNEDILKHAVGGLLDTMKASVAFCAPFANSYRRYRADGWSPSVGNWGHNHRLVSLRIPASGKKDKRIEHRLAGADANPYLLTAAVFAGVHHGIKQAIEPGPETLEGEQVQGGVKLPTRWREALNELNGSDFFNDQFGEEFIDLYLRGKYTEEESFHLEVSDRDSGWYLRTV